MTRYPTQQSAFTSVPVPPPVREASGSVYRRCGCRGPDGRQLGGRCPRLENSGHGTWTLDVHLPGGYGSGPPRRVRRGGYATRTAAMTALTAWRQTPPRQRAAAVWNTGAWLTAWVEAPHRWAVSTRASYRAHIRTYLIPYLGRIPLSALDGADAQRMIDNLTAAPSPFGHRLTGATLERIHATLRAALNEAVRAGVLTSNPARWLRLPPHPRTRAEVWTPGRVAVWQATGERPVAAVWTADHLAAFLQHRTEHADPLLPAWRLIALRGLPRGEACGLRWCDLDLDDGTGRGTLRIVQALVDVAGRTVVSAPKTPSSRRLITLDAATTAMLHWHRDTRSGTPDGRGYVFTNPAGQPLRPERLTRAFHAAVDQSGLPPIRLHDLRHGAASLALAAGVDLKTVQELLGHATIITTADIYAHVLPDVHARAADAVAELIDHADHPRPPLRH